MAGEITVNAVYKIQSVQHSCLEPHAAMVSWDEGNVKLVESTQGVSALPGSLARALGLPQHAVKAEGRFTGGGFGSKVGLWMHTPAVADAAKELGRPVKRANSRAAELMTGGGRPPQEIHASLTVDQDGKVTGRRLQPRPASLNGQGWTTILRGPGAPERQFVEDSVMDEAAEAVGLDPLQVRLVNHMGKKEWFEQGAKRMGWAKRARPAGAGPGPLKRGMGVGLGSFAGRNGCQFAEVEVDVETGQVKVVKVVAVLDGGYLNRLTAEGQVRGGVIMGMSWALFEERMMDEGKGMMVNADWHFYKLASAMDLPEIEVMFLGEQGDVTGLGEQPVVPTGGAIANAVFNATGARVRELPLTPRRVMEALTAVGQRPGK